MAILADPVLETDIIPYYPSTPPGEDILILAPHPDDETLGCGGTIRLLIESKKRVKVLFLTSGDRADPSHSLQHIVPSPLAGEGRGEGEFHVSGYALLREKEAKNALRILGISDYEFLRFPDRELHKNYKTVLEKILKIFEDYRPDTIYTPSMIELNPDHRTTAALSLELQRIVMEGRKVSVGVMPINLVFYEVTTPIRPNILVDITSVYKKKKRAIKQYKSQLKLADYLGHITALNTIRSLTVNKAQHVEAFWFVDKPISDEDIKNWMSYVQAMNTKS